MRRRIITVEYVDEYYDSAYWKRYDRLEKINNMMKSLMHQRTTNNQTIHRLLNEINYLEDKGRITSSARHRVFELKADNLALSAEICTLSNERYNISEQLEEFKSGARW